MEKSFNDRIINFPSLLLQNRFSFTIYISLQLFLTSALLTAQEVSVVPAPQQIEYSTGYFDLNGSISIETFHIDNEESIFIEDLLTAEFHQSISVAFKFASAVKDRKILVGINGDNNAFAKILKTHGLDVPSSLGSEGYQIKVTNSEIIIAANTSEGIFYGIQTLKQLIRTNSDSKNIPGMLISDWPDLEIRGMMDDISRGPVPTKEFMLRQIERLAEMKINMLTYYTQDVVKTERHPEFAPPGGAISIKEWKEIADYAYKYHIDLVGNFQSFGHFDQILKHPKYAHLGENGTLLSPAFDESYELIEDIYKEMIPAFHSNYFHINSDETFDLGSGASKTMVDSLGYDVVYANHIKRIYDIITPMGKTIMIWGDLALKHPTLLSLLPKDIIMVTWNYDAIDDYSPFIVPFKNAGFKFLVSPGVLNSLSIMPDFNTAIKNIGGFINEAIEQDAWGTLNTVWDDGGAALFSRDWYGVAYAADQSWNSNLSDESYDSRFNRTVYASTNDGLTEAIHALNNIAEFKSTEKMNEAIFWDRIIPEKGNSRMINISDWKHVESLVDSAEKCLAKYNPKIYSEDIEYIQLTINQYRYLSKSTPQLVTASEAYSKARAIENSNTGEARRLLLKAYRSVSNSYISLVHLKESHSALWMQENRLYAWDRVERQYDKLIQDIREVKDTLLSATYALDRGEGLPTPSSIRLSIQKTDGWYFRGWLMTQPIPHSVGYKDSDIDQLEATGGISKTFPSVTQEFYFNGEKYRWRRVNTPYFAKVDVSELFDQKEDAVIYAFAHIDINKSKIVRALAGSSAGIQVYINGKLIHKNSVEREFQLDQDEFNLPLANGRNHLMIKTTKGKGDWGFSFRIPDVEMRSTKNRYKIIN